MPLNQNSNFADLAGFFVGYIELIIPFLIGLIILFLFYSAFQYAYKADDKGPEREALFWGVIALFVVVSLWGLVRILCGTFFGSPSCQTNSNYTTDAANNGGGVVQIINK